ncbi:MAG: hypothetical protein JWR16_2479 [Nevskia sp.]|jgi:hypothetical protein|nr:hypothetical protein [Nevskia sp.]
MSIDGSPSNEVPRALHMRLALLRRACTVLPLAVVLSILLAGAALWVGDLVTCVFDIASDTSSSPVHDSETPIADLGRLSSR